MSDTYEYECVNRIKSLKQSIESTTGKTYADLTQAVQGLKDNGGNIEDFVVKNADLGDVVLSDDGTVMGLVSNGLRQGAFAECYVGNVTIPEGINSVPMWCFYDTIFRSNATVILPNSLRTIEKEAFLQADMNNITLPEGLLSIGDNAFRTNIYIKHIVIPSTVTSIGQGCFEMCQKLESAIILANITEIPVYMFYHCKALANITLPESLTTIQTAAFYDCAFTNITLPESLTTINSNAFQFCKNLLNITIPKNVTHIGSSAFADCTNLTDIYLNSTTPPTLQAKDGMSYTATIHVPIGSGSAYRSATNWSIHSGRIVEDIEI